VFQKILLPVDLSDRHGAAVDLATDMAAQGAGEVVLLHVIEVIHGLSQEEEQGFYSRLEKAAQKHLDKLGGPLSRRGVPWRAEISYGNRGLEIVRRAQQGGIDLIVLTAPRFDPKDAGVGWGSLSFKVGFVAPCPVLLVK
jgi:nucleotide-binding universal stress UspA family protein